MGVEERVTTKLMKEIEPSLNTMKNEIQDYVNLDIRRLIKEEMALQKLAEAKDKKKERPKEDVSEETENSEVEEEHAKGEPAKKSKKSKKKYKNRKAKKNEEVIEHLEEDVNICASTSTESSVTPA